MHTKPSSRLLCTLPLLALCLLGCDLDSTVQGSFAPAVGQGGAQDFGAFREVLDAGGIPSPTLLDDMGFFAEHHIAMPTPTCGEDVCIHGVLGVMGNMISGSNCTVLVVGMNTPIDPDELERPPLHLTIALDLSTSMLDSLPEVIAGIHAMLPALEPSDRLSIVGYNQEVEVIAEYLAPDPDALPSGGLELLAGPGSDLYAGLREAFEIVDAHAQDGWQNRVLLVSDGKANAGIQGSDKITGIVEAWAEQGYGLTAIGIGSEVDVPLLRGLAEHGNGAFYYLEDASAAAEVFEEEAQAFLVPLAQDVVIDATVFEGYDLRRVYGTEQAEVAGNHGHIEIPMLQLAHRSADDDADNGRRGGGGAIIMELLPTGENPGEVGRIDFSYTVPGSDEQVEQYVEITSPLGPWETPASGLFLHASAEKAFVMLNIYVGFDMAASFAGNGDYPGALSVLEPLSLAVEGWLDENEDADIQDDLFYLLRFIENLYAQGPVISEWPTPPEPWPRE